MTHTLQANKDFFLTLLMDRSILPVLCFRHLAVLKQSVTNLTYIYITQETWGPKVSSFLTLMIGL